ncbi:MAG: hypothetical protein Q8936_07655 [Bacillota bacterium]|nr:hypothetical protein [Bacillota bacterium]
MSNKKNKEYFGDLPSNYLPNKGKELMSKKLNSSDIVEEKNGNCTLDGKRIEANPCSLIKDDYKIDRT